MSEIIIDKSNEKIDVCLIENNQICEKYTYTVENTSTLGNIYVGRVEAIVSGMQAAFVDIGTGKNAFLPLKDAMPKIDIVKDNVKQKIEISKSISDVLKIGQLLIVQVKKEATVEKGSRISKHITIPGKYVILMPGTDIITVSQKIEDINECERLKYLLKSILPQDFGAIVRTDAKNVREDIIKRDIEQTLKLWEDIQNRGKVSKKIEVLYNDIDIVERVIRDMANTSVEKIYTNDGEITQKLNQKLNIKVEYKKVECLMSELGLLTEFEKINNRKIWLKCGGYIAIDKTEALTAIDVNSGKYVGNSVLEETIIKVNKEAAIEIMKQVRLKDIGGIIIIDYIDMQDEAHKEHILEIMKKEAKKDRSKVDIREFTQLNLVEMTRKKMYV